jgi:hypothetical protein
MGLTVAKGGNNGVRVARMSAGSFWGSFVTFCVTFWGCVLKLLLKLPRFYRVEGAVFLCKRARSDSNC